MRSDDRTCHVQIGKPSLRWMAWQFKNDETLTHQCLMPHFKARSANDLLVFERGRTWEAFQRGDEDYDYFGWEPPLKR